MSIKILESYSKTLHTSFVQIPASSYRTSIELYFYQTIRTITKPGFVTKQVPNGDILKLRY